MQNLAENQRILKYMECKEFHRTSWQLTMERKVMMSRLVAIVLFLLEKYSMEFFRFHFLLIENNLCSLFFSFGEQMKKPRQNWPKLRPRPPSLLVVQFQHHQALDFLLNQLQAQFDQCMCSSWSTSIYLTVWLSLIQSWVLGLGISHSSLRFINILFCLSY